MAHLTVDIGGRPGLDCQGFCKYCYFKGVREDSEPEPLGCKYCLPFSVGCDYCTNFVRERYTGFKDLREVADDVLGNLQLMGGNLERITISGGGDPSCYPAFEDLMDLLGSMEVPIHIGYTSGKGFDDPAIADTMVEQGLSEVSFTVFSINPELRRDWMGDKTPEASLAVLGKLCQKIDVYAASLIIPGVNDGEDLERTCKWLEDKGAKGLILMRFANREDQGLILKNAPVVKGQRVQTVSSFRDMVTDLNERYNLRISGTPLGDPTLGSPFAILEEPGLLEKLPRVRKRASLISGSIAARYVQDVLDACGNRSWVHSPKKEIACLITRDDLKEIDLSSLEKVVILPGRSFVHEMEAAEILSADGVKRTIIRGPDTLTADAETSMGMTRNEVLQMEIDGFSALIHLINQNGE